MVLRTRVNRAGMGSVLKTAEHEDGLARANNLGGIGLMLHHEPFAGPNFVFFSPKRDLIAKRGCAGREETARARVCVRVCTRERKRGHAGLRNLHPRFLPRRFPRAFAWNARVGRLICTFNLPAIPIESQAIVRKKCRTRSINITSCYTNSFT